MEDQWIQPEYVFTKLKALCMFFTLTERTPTLAPKNAVMTSIHLDMTFSSHLVVSIIEIKFRKD